MRGAAALFPAQPTYRGGSSHHGTVFSLTLPASPDGAWTEAALYSFAGRDDGPEPQETVAIGRGGVLYGTTRSGGIALSDGTVFENTQAIAEPVYHGYRDGGIGRRHRAHDQIPELLGR